MVSWGKALSKTRNLFSNTLGELLKSGKAIDEEDLEELEGALLAADMAPRIVADILQQLETETTAEDPKSALKKLLIQQLDTQAPFDWSQLPTKACILMLGVNGSGKTTTCAKLAQQLQTAGKSPLLGAGDTFRAAGTEQLRIWAETINVPIVSGHQNADAAAVAYDALCALHARNVDTLLFDTAGRMHTKKPLMEELRKMTRALQKKDPEAPHEVWIVLDASTGQNALNQALFFNDVIPLTGIIVTKLDGSAKAGFLFSIKQQLHLPIHFAGIGEGAEDLVPFQPEAFVEALLQTHDP